MEAVRLSGIVKSFGPTLAVDGVSFAVQKGEIFGLLGPNGAGKTTTLRIMLDIFKADQGEVSILGGPITEEKKNRIGYMPEERGLYQDIGLETCLVYLATLKGLSPAEAGKRVKEWLVRFDLAPHRSKKVKELSKGMQQKAQIIATIAHRPELIIIDEPFAALDPVNTQMVKDLLRELSGQGTTLILCTHQMHQAEELCDRILLINKGQVVLAGDLEEIRRSYAGNAVWVRTVGELPQLQGVQQIARHNHSLKLTLAEDTAPQDVLKALLETGATVEQFEIALPDLEEVFIRAVGQGGA
jgi:ABC-2 type transport system ATP-binding protein